MKIIREAMQPSNVAKNPAFRTTTKWKWLRCQAAISRARFDGGVYPDALRGGG
jgi:hypothetical protein